MYPVSGEFLSAIRDAHEAAFRVDAYRDGVKLNDESLPLTGGNVTVDRSSRVRRQMEASFSPRLESGVAGSSDVWDLLAPLGTEIKVYRGVRFPDGSTEIVPLGVFGVDAQHMGLGPDGEVRVSAFDRFAAVQRARFLVPQRSTSGALVRVEAARLLTEAKSDIPAATVTATQAAALRSTVWERDRAQAVEDLCKSIGAEAFFDADGVPVVRDIPTLSTAPVWLVDAGARGVLLGGDRERNRQRTYNTVVVTPEQSDSGSSFAPVVVQDDDPTSPTFVGGPMGVVPTYYSSPSIVTVAQAIKAGQAILERVRGLAAQVTLESTVNPALDAGDVIDVIVPRDVEDRTIIERHLIESVTIPLHVEGTQQITTRSTRPEDEIEGLS